MSNKSIILNTNRPGFFTATPRGTLAENRLATSRIEEKVFDQFKNTNLKSTGSFRYGDKEGILSTQQLSIDYTKFESC